MSQIDLVIPMVFPSDAEWQKEYIAACGGSSAVAGKVRFRSWGTEELLVRCCMRNMPWLRSIVVVLASESQVQPWMARLADGGMAPPLRIVFHRDFIPREYLPCFSSPCIEMFVGDIPGLSEQFIYANDDMFPLSPLQPEDFFLDGRPCHRFKEEPFPGNPDMFLRKCQYQQNMIGAPFGIRSSRTWLHADHSFAPVLKSSCREVWRRHGDEIRRCLSPLRRTDCSHNHYIYMLYQQFAGLSACRAPRSRYVGRSVSTASLAGILRDPAAGIVCINDNEGIGDWQRRAAVVREEIESRLSMPRIALCAVGRLENRYAREFVEHYFALGFEHIYICDNNHDGEERFEDVLQDFIGAGAVEVLDYRNREAVQAAAYDETYALYGSRYDWMAFFDFDEFLVMSRRRVGEWLSSVSDGEDVALVNWMVMTDGGLLYDDGRPCMERFTEPVPYRRAVQYSFPEDDHVKSIVRGGLDGVHFRNPHVPVTPGNPSPSPFRPHDFSECRLLHFTTKTVGEWLSCKCVRGVGDRSKMDFDRGYRDRFFRYNARTAAKEAYAEAFVRNAGLTAAVVHYNTPKLTRAAVLSLWKHTPGCRVVVFDNSDRLPIAGCREWDALRRSPLVTVIDNTQGREIDFGALLERYPEREFTDRNKSNFGSAKHTASVDRLLDLLPDGFILMDSDVLFRQDVSGLADTSVAAAGMLQPNEGVMRLLPLLCWLNVPMLREHGIRYFNGEKMWALSGRYPDNRYDTGAWLLEDVRRHGLPVREVDVRPYVLHLGHASWRDRRPMAWVRKHDALWRADIPALDGAPSRM